MIVVSICNGQIVINEILYNIPGNGESEEFIELYNAGLTPISVSNYSFSQGVTFTFPNASIPAGGYYIITADSLAFVNSFGFIPDAQWTSGGLSNSGEDIVLIDNLGNTVDSVDYDDATPWPPEADGQGRSLQLCDPTTDNNVGSNWGISNTPTGVNTTTGTDSLYATPGMINTCASSTPTPVSYPVYTFNQINSIDINGSADSINVTCELRGLVDCIDLRGSGLDFAFVNRINTAGIRVFSFNDVNGYTVNAGDSLHILGTVSQFNGLLQFAPDSISLISSANTTPVPAPVSTLDETTENRSLELSGVHIVDTSAWTGFGAGFNVLVTNGTDTNTIRIDNDIYWYSQPVPTGTFDVFGYGSQFDFSSPYTEGYLLTVCDLSIATSASDNLYTSSVNVYPNPAKGLINFELETSGFTVILSSLTGETITTEMTNTHRLTINTSGLANGIYIYSILGSDYTPLKSDKIVVNN
ncbi:MAG: lamin tail domain-containing protein [Flavobacteriales bacterium]|nr:lamin tail domain-containing protein [Flavobacteriales bacterium]